MKIRIPIIILLTFIYCSCSKTDRIEKKLSGTWKISKVTIDDSEGFYFEDPKPIGIIAFDPENKTVSGKINFEYTNSALTFFKDSLHLASAKYQIDSKLTRLYVNSNGTTYDFRIILLTSTDLQIEFYDLQLYKQKRFVLVKQND
jgi:hypothetical protein